MGLPLADRLVRHGEAADEEEVSDVPQATACSGGASARRSRPPDHSLEAIASDPPAP